MKKVIIGMFLSVFFLFASINPNTATKKELMEIKGIGDKKAESIIKYRKNKKINSVKDLKNIKGFGPQLISNIKNDVKKSANVKKSKTSNKIKDTKSKKKINTSKDIKKTKTSAKKVKVNKTKKRQKKISKQK